MTGHRLLPATDELVMLYEGGHTTTEIGALFGAGRSAVHEAFRRAGITLTTPQSAGDRFWSKVNTDGPPSEHRPDLGPCWLWTAAMGTYGYGRFRMDGKTFDAHLVSWQMVLGPVPHGRQLDHLCRVRPCVRLTHLEPVTQLENIRRGSRPAQTHCKRDHEFTEANTIIRRNGTRQCRACIAVYRERPYNTDRRR